MMTRNRWVEAGGVLTAAVLMAGCASEEPEEPESDAVESQQQNTESPDTAETQAETDEAAAETDETGSEEPADETAETDAAETDEAAADEAGAEEQTSGEDGWVEAESGSGEYVAEFPAEPMNQSQTVPELGAEQDLTVAEVGQSAYLLSEVPLDGAPFDLDASVQGNIQGVLASLEQQTGQPGEVVPISEETGEFEGEETREAAVDIEAGDLTAHYRVVAFVREDALVQVAYTGEQSTDQEDADRFFDSFGLN